MRRAGEHMNKSLPARVNYRRWILLALLVLASGGVLGGYRNLGTAQAQSVVTCVVAEGDTCAAGPAHIVALLGESFVLEIRVEDFVDADDDGDTLPEGLGAFQFTLDYDPDVVSVSGVSDEAEVQALFLGSSGRSVMCVEPLLATSFVQLACATLSLSPLGPTGSGVVARVMFQPGGQADVSTELTLRTTVTDWLANPEPHTAQGATVTVLDPLADTDGDGCTNSEELGSDPALGGQRDPLNPYDFYDITDITFVLGSKDKGVSGFDLNLLVLWAGAITGGGPNANGKDYDADGNGNTIADGLELDFAGIAGPATGPDGGISGFDLAQMLYESGDSCAAPP
jgi:hypothetical protein